MSDTGIYKSKNATNTRGRLALIILVVVGIIGTLVVLAVMTKTVGEKITKDSGIAACEQMAVRVNQDSSSSPSGKISESDYQAARVPFENSRYADLRVAGTNVVDTMYSMDKSLDSQTGDVGAALLAISSLQTNWTALQTACSAHGVNVPQLNFS